MAVDVLLVNESFDPGALAAAFDRDHPDAGGIASFVGKVRPTGGVEALELTHYEPLTLPGMETLAQEAGSRWQVMGLLIVHRTGVMQPGEPIVLVAAAARHRRDAIAAVDFCMDHLKSDSWFWKRERRDGAWHWIEPREQDFEDLARWKPAAASG